MSKPSGPVSESSGSADKSLGDGARRTVSVEAGFNLQNTVRGAKNPVMIGPNESCWATRTPDGPGTLTLTRTADTKVVAEAWGPGRDWLLHQTPRILGHDDDLGNFQPPDPLRRIWLQAPFRLARTDVLWDALVGAIFGQKVQVRNAVQARRRLARAYGQPAPGPATGFLLPTPSTVAEMGYAAFHPLGVERKRAETLIRAAREMPRLEGLTERPPEELQRRLQTIRGIGPWSAAMVSAVALGDPDAVPVGDFHLPNTVSWALAREPRADDARMLELLEPWRGHRWRVLRLAKASGPAPRYGPRLSYTDDGLHRGR